MVKHYAQPQYFCATWHLRTPIWAGEKGCNKKMGLKTHMVSVSKMKCGSPHFPWNLCLISNLLKQCRSAD